MGQGLIQKMVDIVVLFATDILMPLMLTVFFVAVILRILNYVTLKRQYFFTTELSRRIDRFFEAIESTPNISFFMAAKKLLIITYYEIFEVSALLQRRKPDVIMSLSDRVFLNKQGFAWLVKKTLKQIRHLKIDNSNPPLLDISKNVFQNNPCFTRIFGYIPSGFANDVLNMLPGMFIVGGIFGTFLGVMQALPDLSNIKIEDAEGARIIMNQFLLKLSYSMSTSILGIVLSVIMSIVNATFSAERIFVKTIENFENCLHLLWNRSDNNSLPAEALKFDENKNPVEALAEEALNKEYQKMRKRLLEDEHLGKPERPDLTKAS